MNADPRVVKAHDHSIFHHAEIVKSSLCGCFCCLKTFAPDTIVDWTDTADPRSKTALCPHCGIDSVIGSASGFPIEESFLRAMSKHWF